MSETNRPQDDCLSAGYNRPQTPQDDYTAELYRDHGLGETPSLEVIEPVAKALLADPLRLLDGMSMVLGRQVNAAEFANDFELDRVMLFSKPADKFGMLLIKKAFDPADQGEQ
jgi:hypothetical protein